MFVLLLSCVVTSSVGKRGKQTVTVIMNNVPRFFTEKKTPIRTALSQLKLIPDPSDWLIPTVASSLSVCLSVCLSLLMSPYVAYNVSGKRVYSNVF